MMDEADTILSDLTEARAYWDSCREREERAKRVMIQVIRDARDSGRTLEVIAHELGVSRQYVHKLLRAGDVADDREAYMARRYEPEAARRSMGRTGGYSRPQCGGCKRFLKAAGAQCESCGYIDGGGYFAAPAKTSHLERWH